MMKKWWSRFWASSAVLISLLALWITAVWFTIDVFQPSLTRQTQGFGAYYSAARLLADGETSAEIYDPDYFRPLVLQYSLGQAEDIYNANPPTTSLILWPLSFLEMEDARILWVGFNVAFLLGGIAVLMRGFGVPLRDRRKWPLWSLAIILALLFQPTKQNFLLGQAYGLIFLLISATTAAFVKGRPIGGIPLALSILLKTVGWPLIILFLWLRKGRFIAWVMGTAVLIFVATLPFFPLNMWLAFARLLARVSREPSICLPAFQTTRSWLCHLFAPDVVWYEAGISIPIQATIVYYALGLICLVIVLILARKRPNAAFIATICWCVLFLPLGETYHHLIMLIPFIWLLTRAGDLSPFGQLLVILAVCLYLVGFKANDPQVQSGIKALLAYPYLAGAWLTFIVILWDQKSTLVNWKSDSESV